MGFVKSASEGAKRLDFQCRRRGFALLERPGQGFGRGEGLGWLDVLIADLPADFEVLLGNVGGEFDELYLDGFFGFF